MGRAVLHKLVARGLTVGRPDVATRRSGLAAAIKHGNKVAKQDVFVTACWIGTKHTGRRICRPSSLTAQRYCCERSISNAARARKAKLTFLSLISNLNVR